MGLDGSGKTTSVLHSCQRLKSMGYRVQVVRSAYVVKYLAPLIRLGKKLVLRQDSDPYGGDYLSYLKKMQQQGEHGLAYRVFSTMTSVEFGLQILWHICIKRLLGTLLLADRYIYDNVVTHSANLGLDGEAMKHMMNKKWRYAPKADLLIYIRTPVAICCTRKHDIPDPLYLEIREPLYDQIAAMYPSTMIPGDQEMSKMLQMVDDAIDDLLRRWPIVRLKKGSVDFGGGYMI
jgi:thymidylate kinase